MAEYWQRVRAFPPSLWRLLLAAGLTLLVWLGLMAVLYNLYLLRLGFDARAIGLLNGVGALVWGLTALPAGLLSNRLGLRNSIQLGMGLYGLGIALTLLVESVPPAQWQTWLLICQVVMNIGIAFATVNAPPYVMAVAGEAERPYAFGFLSALNPLAALVGSLAAGVLPGLLGGWFDFSLDQPDPYRLALWLGPLFCAFGVLPLFGAESGGYRVAGPGPLAAERTHAPVRLLAFWAFIIFLTAIGEGTVRTFFNVLLDTGFGVAPASIGLIMGAAQVLPFVVALAVPLLLTRWGAGRTLFAGLLGLVLCLMLFAAGSYFGVRVPGSVGTALGIIGAAYLALAAALAVVRASRNLFGQELVAPRWRTSSQGAGALGLAFGVAVAGTAGGAIVTAVGFSAMFAAGALVTLISALCLYVYLQRSARHHAAPTLPQPAGRA